MPPSETGISPKAIGWALLSQVFWVPLVAIDLHDHWQAEQRDTTPPDQPLPPSPLARATPFSVNDLLAAKKPVQLLASQASQAIGGVVGQAVSSTVHSAGVLLNTAGSTASSLLEAPLSVALDSPAHAAPIPRPSVGSTAIRAVEASLSSNPHADGVLGRAFTRVQLLGGSIGLDDLNEGPMAPLALAERAMQTESGDPLAPLPSPWREPMRQALQKLPGSAHHLSPARIVHVPSSGITQSVEVPLAIQSDGTVDILEAPADPAVLREIDAWSRQQRLPATGSLTPAVIHLHPMPAATVTTPTPETAAVSSTPAVPTAAVQTTESAPASASSPAAGSSNEPVAVEHQATPTPSQPASAELPAASQPDLAPATVHLDPLTEPTSVPSASEAPADTQAVAGAELAPVASSPVAAPDQAAPIP